METLVDISKALNVPGWIQEDELKWLAEQATYHKCIVEIGSYLGRSTRALAENTSGFVLAIDDWCGPRDIDISIDERKSLFDKFKIINKDLIDSGKLRFIRMDYSGLRFLRLDFKPDMIFIDGDHSYKSVLRDVRWANSVLSEGLLCGHDHYMTTVKQVVKAFFGKKYYTNMDLWFANKEIRYGAPPRN